ncbi:hypothetical protein KAFR_0A01160 [Kazachstania africana CBS 2517]|uniref:Transmembrane protein n=1 Tax=Kazachstania africana (strain ATCC 22294 / BCRC 22015 / CBS 2517 / CECT 1963 / NBRC 1671 / NRRL Y-8276) TaxID=1071382 RepID=H2AMF5_KAZAF|nr:hypothetical protein KAFR_0A01160 [Kazachstania africana CBS 2517]CCF55555.1 hypothetical protein KAFR_0A01160 [Kazachstania africana CBS 2517]
MRGPRRLGDDFFAPYPPPSVHRERLLQYHSRSQTGRFCLLSLSPGTRETERAAFPVPRKRKFFCFPEEKKQRRRRRRRKNLSTFNFAILTGCFGRKYRRAVCVCLRVCLSEKCIHLLVEPVLSAFSWWCRPSIWLLFSCFSFWLFNFLSLSWLGCYLNNMTIYINNYSL